MSSSKAHESLAPSLRPGELFTLANNLADRTVVLTNRWSETGGSKEKADLGMRTAFGKHAEAHFRLVNSMQPGALPVEAAEPSSFCFRSAPTQPVPTLRVADAPAMLFHGMKARGTKSSGRSASQKSTSASVGPEEFVAPGGAPSLSRLLQSQSQVLGPGGVPVDQHGNVAESIVELPTEQSVRQLQFGFRDPHSAPGAAPSAVAPAAHAAPWNQSTLLGNSVERPEVPAQPARRDPKHGLDAAGRVPGRQQQGPSPNKQGPPVPQPRYNGQQAGASSSSSMQLPRNSNNKSGNRTVHIQDTHHRPAGVTMQESHSGARTTGSTFRGGSAVEISALRGPAASLGALSSAQLGMEADLDTAQAVDWEAYSRQQLQLLNFSFDATPHDGSPSGKADGVDAITSPGAGRAEPLSAIDDPTRNGTLLCGVLELAANVVGLPPELAGSAFLQGGRGSSLMLKLDYASRPRTVREVVENVSLALHVARVLLKHQSSLDAMASGLDSSMPEGDLSAMDSSSTGAAIRDAIPIPHSLLHISAEELLAGGPHGSALWGLTALAIHNWVACAGLGRRLQAAMPPNSTEIAEVPRTQFMFGRIPLARVCVPVDVRTLAQHMAVDSDCIPPLIVRPHTDHIPHGFYPQQQARILEAVICQFLFDQGVLPRCHTKGKQGDGNSDPQGEGLIPSALRAPYVSMGNTGSSSSGRASSAADQICPQTLASADVLPHLANGTLLCDVVMRTLATVREREAAQQSRLLAAQPGTHFGEADRFMVDAASLHFAVHRNPRVPRQCLANISSALSALSKLPRSVFYHGHVRGVTQAIYNGDRATILLLLEDIIRLYFAEPPRDTPVSERSKCFVPVMYRQYYADRDKKRSGSRAAVGRKPVDGETSAVVRERVELAVGGSYLNRERSAFAADTGSSILHTTAASRQILGGVSTAREGSVGATETATTSAAGHKALPFTAADMTHGPAILKPRTRQGTTAVSSGRSVVAPDAFQDRHELDDEPEEDSRELPPHLRYLEDVPLHDAAELDALVRWLKTVLGPHYSHTGKTTSFSTKAFRGLTSPCGIFADGFLLRDLVSVLSHRSIDVQLTTSTQARAACKTNIRKVVQTLLYEKKIPRDLPFVEEALVDGNVSAVVLLLRTLRTAFKSFQTNKYPK